MERKIRVAIRSVGRPQVVSVLTSIWNCRDLIKGIIFLGELGPAGGLFQIIKESEVFEIDWVSGLRKAGENSAIMYRKLSLISPDEDILILDDDVLFCRQDISQAKKLFDGGYFDSVSVFHRGGELETYIETFGENPLFSTFFTFCKSYIFEALMPSDFELIDSVPILGDDCVITWLFRDKGFKVGYAFYRGRPYHMSIVDQFGWRHMYEQLAGGDKLVMACKTREEVKEVVTRRNDLLRKGGN